MAWTFNPFTGQLDYYDSSGGGSGTLTTIKEGGVQLGGADIVTLDFDGDDFNLTESPDTEINITVNDGGIDHGSIAGLSDDDHTQYSLVAGTRAFTGKVSYNAHPTFSADTEIVDKKYVDDAITAGGGGGLTYSEVTGTSQSASVDNAYVTNNAALVTVTLPSTASIGERVVVIGKGAGGWQVAQNSGQTIIVDDNTTSTSGATGHIDSADRYAMVELTCITADTTWLVTQHRLGINET